MAALVASLTRVCGGMAATLGTLFMCNTEESVVVVGRTDTGQEGRDD